MLALIVTTSGGTELARNCCFISLGCESSPKSGRRSPPCAPACALRAVPEELHFADVAGVVLADEEISFPVHRHSAILADSEFSRIPEPSAVPGVRVRSGAVEEKVNRAVHIHIPDLTAAMG